MLRPLIKLLRDERGQDLIEYVLLGSFIALVGAVGFNAISTALNGSYTSWDSTNRSLWEVPAPK